MKLIIFFLLSISITFDVFANVNFIEIAKITNDAKLVKDFNLIKENDHYYNQWTANWTFDKPKQNLVNILKNDFATFSAIPNKNSELYLLLGDISHYLYNLEDSVYFKEAIKYYNLADKENPNDFRNSWFLANHYALSDKPKLAIENFLKSKELLPNDKPAEFWNDLAFSSYTSNMPSLCNYAMANSKLINGKPSVFESQYGELNNSRIIEIDKDKNYKKEEIWEYRKNENAIFTSRPLGIRISLKPDWGISVNDYSKNQGAFIISPPPLTSNKGNKIEYTIAILIKTANEKDELEDNINKLIAKYPKKNKISFTNKYDKIISYEIKDSSMYQNFGGGHLYILGIERTNPFFPGLLLEMPFELPKSEIKQKKSYRPKASKDRFKGKILYTIILDSCEEINEQSIEIFKTFFNKQIVIE